jgi:hypothetical protein
MPSDDRALHALRTWLDSWDGTGHVAVGMHRQGDDLQLTQYDDRGWRTTFYTTAVRAEGATPTAPMLLLPALNTMIDITTTRTMARQMHPPRVFVMFWGLALAASLLAGYSMTGSKIRSRFHMLGFVLVMAVG